MKFERRIGAEIEGSKEDSSFARCTSLPGRLLYGQAAACSVSVWHRGSHYFDLVFAARIPLS